MKWEKWVKEQLRAYLIRELKAEDIKADLAAIDEMLTPRIANYSEVPSYSSHKKGSVVEYFVWKRAKVRRALETKLEELKKQTELMETALASLSEFHRSLITRLFLTFEKEEDIRKDLKLTHGRFSSQRRAALSHLYDHIVNGYEEGNSKAERG